ncbi:hypothetical protein ABUY89_003372 [Escherichia coli]
MIIELNHYHDPRVAELADIVIPGAPPRRNSVSIFHAMDRVGTRYVQIDPKKIVAVVETNLPDAGNMLDKQNPMCQQIADNVVTFLLQEMAHGRIPPEFLPLQSGVGNINNAVMARLGENPVIPPFMMYSEVLQESVVHLLETGKISGASASSLQSRPIPCARFTTIWITLPAALCCVRRRFPITRKSSVVWASSL